MFRNRLTGRWLRSYNPRKGKGTKTFTFPTSIAFKPIFENFPFCYSPPHYFSLNTLTSPLNAFFTSSLNTLSALAFFFFFFGIASYSLLLRPAFIYTTPSFSPPRTWSFQYLKAASFIVFFLLCFTQLLTHASRPDPLQASLPFLAAIDPRMPIRVITLSCLLPTGTFKSPWAKWWDVLSGLWHIYSSRPGLHREFLAAQLSQEILSSHRLTKHLLEEEEQQDKHEAKTRSKERNG